MYVTPVISVALRSPLRSRSGGVYVFFGVVQALSTSISICTLASK